MKPQPSQRESLAAEFQDIQSEVESEAFNRHAGDIAYAETRSEQEQILARIASTRVQLWRKYDLIRF